MAAINMLEKDVYELIAAGEVIERPASVIKELIENSIDAKASSIVIEIKDGGRTFMRVTDNGCGMSSDDVPTAFLRHATSKVRTKSDLEKIITLGFRGEALASVCAVSKTELLTKRREDTLGTKYLIEASVKKEASSVGCPDGTSMIVRDLFYNVPARLKFLKKDTAEANRIQELVCKIALSHPRIAFRFIRDNRPVIMTAGNGDLYAAIYSVLGRDLASTLIPVSYANGGTAIDGFVSKPLLSRNNRRSQIFFVNGRSVSSTDVCSAALEEAYKNSIMTGKFPACVLRIRVPADSVDVNVHPAKTEIRFSDPRYVYDSVYFAVKDALAKNDEPTQMRLAKPKFYEERDLYSPPETPEPQQMTFEKNEPKTFGEDLFLNSLENASWAGVLAPEDNKNAAAEQQSDSTSVTSEPQTSQQTAASEPEQDRFQPKETPSEPVKQNTSGGYKFIRDEDFKKKTPAPQVQEQPEIPETPKPFVVGELFKTYIVAQCGEEMLLIDKHAAHERYIFEKIKKNRGELSAQTLLSPVPLTLSYEEYSALEQSPQSLEKLGFIIEFKGAPYIAVAGVPMVIGNTDPSELISEIASRLISQGRDPSPQLFDDICHTIACKAAIKANDESSLNELQRLVNSIYGRDDIRYCPHGRPVMITMPRREIEKQFKRIV